MDECLFYEIAVSLMDSICSDSAPGWKHFEKKRK